jgi:NAD(P)-dependent dehydrogenase (short-subunit alcohol dehydrogenase family)
MTCAAGSSVIITGAAGGIGSALVDSFLASGIGVVAMDRDARGLEALESRVPARSALLTARGDVAEPDDMRAAVELGTRHFGGLDHAVLNAGIEGCVAPVDRYPVEQFLEVLRVNVRGVWCGMQAVIPPLRRSGAGSVVIISSISGVMGFPGVAAYTAAKHAVLGIMRSAALELAPQVRVNALAPGFVTTRMTRDLERQISPQDPAAAHEAARLRTPLQRYAAAGEIAAAVRFLASDAASFCTGSVLSVDGGFAT